MQGQQHIRYNGAQVLDGLAGVRWDEMGWDDIAEYQDP